MLNVAIEFVIERLRVLDSDEAAICHSRLTDLLETGDRVSAALYLSAVAAVTDVAAMAGAAGFLEEHQTACFMGSLATNLGWSLTSLSATEDPPAAEEIPDVYWATYSHPEEAEIGADFGLIGALGSHTGEQLYNVALFQAKRPQGGKIKLQHVIGSQNSDTRILAEIDDHYKTVEDPSEGGDSWFNLQNRVRNLEPAQPGTQFEALARAQLSFPQHWASLRSSWCHYVAWHLPREGGISLPTVLPLDRAAVLHEGSTRRIDLEKFKYSLIERVYDVFRGTLTPSYVTLTSSELRGVIAKCAHLMPWMQWMAVGEGDGGLVNVLLNGGCIDIKSIVSVHHFTQDHGFTPPAFRRRS